MEDDGYNLVRTVRARDAERGRDLRARAGSRRVRQDRRSSATLVGRARGPGLRLLGDVPWGRHVALFYERKEDVLELCVPFLKAGLESTGVCIWVIAEPLTERDAWAALGAAVSPRDLDRYRADRRIEMLQSQAWYFIRDSPDLQKAARGWEAKRRTTESLPLGQGDARPVRLPDHRASRSRRHAYASVDHQEAPRGIGSAIGENGR